MLAAAGITTPLRDYPQTAGHGKCLARPRDRPVPSRTARTHPGYMTPGTIIAGIAAVVITACLLSIVVFFLLGAVIAALTIAQARRRAKHRPELLTQIARDCAVNDLAEIDDKLEQVLAQEYGWWPAAVPHGSLSHPEHGGSRRSQSVYLRKTVLRSAGP